MKLLQTIFRCLFALYVGLVFFLCLYTFKDNGLELPPSFFGIELDKIIHFSMFLPFAISAWLAFGSLLSKNLYKSLLYIYILGLILCFTAEFAQNLNPARQVDKLDLAANILGNSTGTLLLYLMTLLPYFRYRKYSN